MLSTAQVKPVLETIAVKALHLASKARWYVGGIVSYPNSLVARHRCLKGMEAGAEMCTLDEAAPYFV
ncbi:hypothetical protein [Caballeronia sordidicola]|uniref:hypothetical protein n=1 Tax=Caballeronia sordidicola TaxID=196367 RepID=UPI001F1E0A0F|nr:hypothetical protein [Caballeronia sordidicola]